MKSGEKARLEINQRVEATNKNQFGTLATNQGWKVKNEPRAKEQVM